MTPGQITRTAVQYLWSIGARALGEHQTKDGRRKLWVTRDHYEVMTMLPRHRLRATIISGAHARCLRTGSICRHSLDLMVSVSAFAAGQCQCLCIADVFPDR
jgi:hypothetical protein